MTNHRQPQTTISRAVHTDHRRLVTQPQEAMDVAHADGVGQTLRALQRQAQQLLPPQPVDVTEREKH